MFDAVINVFLRNFGKIARNWGWKPMAVYNRGGDEFKQPLSLCCTEVELRLVECFLTNVVYVRLFFGVDSTMDWPKSDAFEITQMYTDHWHIRFKHIRCLQMLFKRRRIQFWRKHFQTIVCRHFIFRRANFDIKKNFQE